MKFLHTLKQDLSKTMFNLDKASGEEVMSLLKRLNTEQGCESYYTFVVKHRLNSNGNNSSMSGSVSLT